MNIDKFPLTQQLEELASRIFEEWRNFEIDCGNVASEQRLVSIPTAQKNTVIHTYAGIHLKLIKH